MKICESKLKAYIKQHGVDCEHLSFEQSCHSVEDACKAVNAREEDFVKNICMISADGKLIVAIVKGEDRVSTERVSKVLNITRPRISTPEEILQLSGYPCGGTPSFGYSAIFLIDERIMEKDFVYTGGGSKNSLVKIFAKELLRANNGQVARIRK